MTARSTQLPLGVRLELGGHRVPMQYTANTSPTVPIRQFEQWEPFFTLVLVY